MSRRGSKLEDIKLELKESLDSNSDSDPSNEWTERGIDHLLMTSKYASETALELEILIEKIRGRIAIFTLLTTILSTFSTSGLCVSFIENIYSIYNQSNPYYQIILNILSFVSGLITTIMLTYLKLQSYEDQLNIAYEVNGMYVAIISEINNEIYKKNKHRKKMSDVFKKLNHDLEKINKKQLKLSLKSRDIKKIDP